jgi:hypothetical protein
MTWRSSIEEQRKVSADGNEMPMKALSHSRMDPNIRPGDRESSLLGPTFINPSQNEVGLKASSERF